MLIHGGSGGVGAAAIQMLRAWRVDKVVATCSARHLDLVRGLGARAVDYAAPDARARLLAEAPFDLVLDCARSDLCDWSDCLLGAWRNSVHVGLLSPLMLETDRHGLPLGLLGTAAAWVQRNLRVSAAGAASGLQNAAAGRVFVYAFFQPSQKALRLLSRLLESGEVSAARRPHLADAADARPSAALRRAERGLRAGGAAPGRRPDRARPAPAGLSAGPRSALTAWPSLRPESPRTAICPPHKAGAGASLGGTLPLIP